uniref:Uncharacterized protein n=1 Tax=Roseihalotalea indica TaxID=2867963 RepID=A0AA49GKA2_9BACT|nr:hypothetical protein K4G66_28895 [Tunicatimonas sp. TK19036]
MGVKQIFGIIFTLLGTAILLFAVYAMLSGTASFMDIEVGGFQIAIVAILGLIFFSAGVKFIR